MRIQSYFIENMSKLPKPEVDVDVEHLDSDIYSYLDEHLRNSTVVLQDILKDTKVSENFPIETDDGQMCQHCGKIYKTNSTLQAHYLLMHPQNNLEGQCKMCDKKYPSLLSLQKHIRYMHRYEHRCKACYRTFATPELLVVHGKECNKSETPCMQCGKVYDSQLALRNHIKYKHPDKNKHWCDLCRRTFTTHRRLVNHNASIHPRGATDCRWCDKTFNSITRLQSHILYKHSEDGAKCIECHKMFAKKTGLQKHLEKNHFYCKANKTERTSQVALQTIQNIKQD